MTELALLTYVPDLFAVHESRFMVRAWNAPDRVVTPAELTTFPDPILTIDLPGLVDDLRRAGHAPPRRVVDFGEALRLHVGKSKDDGGEREWNVWPPLIRRFKSPADAEMYQMLMLARAERPPVEEIIRILSAALDALQAAWIDLASSLGRAGEFERLTAIEWPLQSLFAYRQYRGIQIDPTRAASILQKISSDKYTAFHYVASTLNVSPTGLRFGDVGKYLASTDISHLAEEDASRLQDAFELASDWSPFARHFLTFVKASRDEAIVRRALGGEDRLFPIFNVLGTISGRILVSDPHLQQLRKSYRDLVAPELGTRLIYLDYSQFEPGVLAGLSEDAELIRAYNAGDLYIELAKALFKDPRKRPLAKRIFLAFSYGMSPDRIAQMLTSERSAAERTGISAAIADFFGDFPGLGKFRDRQEEALEDSGQVSSLMGNRRIRRSSGRLTHKERRWALNHPVQSTATLLFKEALIQIEAECGRDAIVLPVHDAVLLQLPDDNTFEAKVENASSLMKAAFKARFPKVEARITAGPFAEA